MIAFLNGLFVFFLATPYAAYLVYAFGNGDMDDMIKAIKDRNSFLLNLYMIYYPIAGLAAIILFIVFMAIYTVGKEVTIF